MKKVAVLIAKTQKNNKTALQQINTAVIKLVKNQDPCTFMDNSLIFLLSFYVQEMI